MGSGIIFVLRQQKPALPGIDAPSQDLRQTIHMDGASGRGSAREKGQIPGVPAQQGVISLAARAVNHGRPENAHPEGRTLHLPQALLRRQLALAVGIVRRGGRVGADVALLPRGGRGAVDDHAGKKDELLHPRLPGPAGDFQGHFAIDGKIQRRQVHVPGHMGQPGTVHHAVVLGKIHILAAVPDAYLIHGVLFRMLPQKRRQTAADEGGFSRNQYPAHATGPPLRPWPGAPPKRCPGCTSCRISGSCGGRIPRPGPPFPEWAIRPGR